MSGEKNGGRYPTQVKQLSPAVRPHPYASRSSSSTRAHSLSRPVTDFHRYLQMQQRRHTGHTSGGGAPRRSLMSPFAAQPGATYQQQPQQASSFLQYPIPMEDSIQPQQPQQQIPPQGRYWQAPIGIDTSNYSKQGRYWQEPTEMDTSNYVKQGRHSDNLDLRGFGGILDTDSTTTGTSARGAVSDTASDMSMTSFDVNPFHGDTGSSIGDSSGFHPTVATDAIYSRSQVSAAEPTQAYFSSNPKATTPSRDSDTSALVDAAYTLFSESSNEPDLRTEKLSKDRSEKCQFHDCPNRARVSQSYGNFCNRHVIVAPCGFPGCRDKAMERAVMCEKHMELGKEALQEILDARSQNVPVCKMSGCFKNDQGRGYCRGHEKLLMATGRLPPHTSKRRLNSAYTMCSYPECNKHSQRHHLCRTHGNLIIKQAQELADRPGATESYEEILGRMQKEIRRCTHANCTKNSQRDRLCTTHYFEKHHLQKDGSAPRISPSGAVASKKKVAPRQ